MVEDLYSKNLKGGGEMGRHGVYYPIKNKVEVFML